MKRQWQIRRQFQPTVDGARRWDHAYQHLMQWSQPTEATTAPVPSTPLKTSSEVMYDKRHLCPRLDRLSSPRSHH
jgi:hypothetical protein